MKLYEMTLAPNPRRVRIFLAEKGVEIEKKQIDIMSGENLSEEYLKVSPRGVVPVLELDDGTTIDETVAICRYFEELHPKNALMGTDAKSKALIESRQRQIEFDGLLPLADIVRNSIPEFSTRAIAGAEGVDAIAELISRGVASYIRFMGRLNNMLADNEYVAGDSFSIADITGMCVVDFAKMAKISIPTEHTNTLRWYNLVSSRPSASA